MISHIVDEIEPILLVGGGKHRKQGLRAAEGLFARIVAADGGADWLVRRGIVPDAVIGDMDSISEATRAALPAELVHEVSEQDSTDFEKCLSRISAPVVIGAGFLGGRVDHALAAMHGLAAFAGQPCVLIGRHDLVFLAPPRLELDLKTRTRVSLFPLGAVRARSKGLRWEVDGVRFDPRAKIGTSNEARGRVTLEAEAPEMLVILPRCELPLVVQALRGGRGDGWSAHRA